MGITFRAREVGEGRLREGLFKAEGRELKTPHFFPILNVITGPPTPPNPLMANGGIWKWFKRLSLRDTHVPSRAPHHELEGFLTQVLHFLDYHISPQMLDRWLGTRGSPTKRSIPEYLTEELSRIKEQQGEGPRAPFIFLDSGGFKLLKEPTLDLRRYGWRMTPEKILDAQLAFGGDLLASLDYPVLPRANDQEARERFQRSRNNAITALKALEARGIEDKLLYLAVHGRDRRETYEYTRSVLRRVKTLHLNDRPFGLAIGSLVPLNSSPKALLDSVWGAMQALDESGVDKTRIPIHAFGVNSGLAPYLTFLGVDSYDGSSFVQAAQNLTYLSPGGFTPQKLPNLTELQCRCRCCTLINRGEWLNAPKGAPTTGIAAVNYILSDRVPSYGYFEWKDGYVDNERAPPKTKKQAADETLRPRGVPRSYFYALLALHNLENNRQLVRILRGEAKGETRLSDLVAASATTPKAQRLLQYVAPYISHAPQTIWSTSTNRLHQLIESMPPAKASIQLAIPKVASRSRQKVDPTNGSPSKSPRRALASRGGSTSYDVVLSAYKMHPATVVLLLPCSKTKPYSVSSMHKHVETSLREAGIDLKRVQKVTISGKYGPVPRELENHKDILSYDYLLKDRDKSQIKDIAKQVQEFLERHEGKYGHVVAFCTQRPYRKALETALRERTNASLLPNPLRRHTTSQFRSSKNLSQLAAVIKSHLESARHEQVRNR